VEVAGIQIQTRSSVFLLRTPGTRENSFKG